MKHSRKMSKHHSDTSKDINEEEPTGLEKFVELCRIAIDLFNQEAATKQNNIATCVHSSPSLPKEQASNEISGKTPAEDPSLSSFCKFNGKRCMDDHVYLNDKEGPSRVCKFNGERCVDDYDYLNDKEGPSRVCKFNGKRCVDDHDYLNDTGVSSQVCKFNEKRCVDDHEYLKDKEVPSRVCKFIGKRHDDDRDDLNDNGGPSRVCKFNGKRYDDDRDYSCNKKVLLDLKGKKRLNNYYDSKNYKYSKKKGKEKTRNNVVAKNKVVEIAPLQLELKNRIQQMGGDDVKLVIQKHMFAADIESTQNRFSIPVKQIREDAKDFLTENELLLVPIEVPLIEPNLNLTKIVIRKWNYSNKSSSYALSGPWNQITLRNNLEAGMEMQLWCFRVDGKLNLALVKVSRDNEQAREIDGTANTSQINVESQDQQAASSADQMDDMD